MRILVLGVGNILLSDEGIGVRVIEALEQRYVMPEGVDVLDGGTAGMELLEAMAIAPT
jgi:hydrogenase maturation protease